jgi:dihydroorotase/N-acyl-D-amino-acid deacylase
MRALLPVLAVALLSSCSSSPGAVPPGPAVDARFDVIIAGGRVVDGTGNAWFLGDVGVRGDRIAHVGPAGTLARAAAQLRIDARGMVVAPGFIDLQSGSYDNFLIGDGRSLGKVTQGVTTEIMGEAYTPAPWHANMEPFREFFFTDRHSEAARAMLDEFRGARGFGTWLGAMERHGVSVNVGSFLGASTVRAYAKGHAEGPASSAELDTMRAVMRRAMEDGAFGLGTALIYPPGNYASTAELVEIARSMAPYHGVYITHMRSEGDRFLEAMDEAIAIGREAGVPVEIYHLKAAGQRNWHKAALAIAKIDSARAEGQDVSANMYPYVAGGTALAACLPPWASADGKLLTNLADSVARRRIRAELVAERAENWENLCQLATPAGVRVGGFAAQANLGYENRSLADIATARGQEWPDALIDLTLEEKARLDAMFFLMSEENLALQIRQPWMKFGTDAGSVDSVEAGEDETHPRAYGTYPRILGRFVRERRVLALEDAVRKMTWAVATRLSLPDRGLVAEGMHADLVVFDPETVIDHATYERSHQLSTGIRDVLVNGVAVMLDGVHTGAKPGRALRGAGSVE